MNKISAFFKQIHRQLFALHDSPQRVAIGFGLGVFTGIFPGMGPLASIVLATFLRINKASALIGSLLTNTWISVLAFLLAFRIGGAFFSVPWEELSDQWQRFLQSFHWQQLFTTAALKIILPVAAGYLAVAVAAGVIGYLFILLLLTVKKHV